MVRYYFHVENDSYTRDESGVELDTIERVRDQASNAAGEILTSELRAGRANIGFQIQIEDPDDKRIMTIVISGAVVSDAATTGTLAPAS